MCSCIPYTEKGDQKKKSFLIGKLDNKPANEKVFYAKAYDGLSKVRLGKVEQKTEGNSQDGDGLFSPPLEGNTEDHQTYVQWRAAVQMNIFARITEYKRTTVYIQPIGSFPETIVDFTIQLNSCATNLFGILQKFADVFFLRKEVVCLPSVIIGEKGWKITKRTSKLTGEPQLLVKDFFPNLKKLLPPDGVCVIGISWLDLYPCEKLNFVLGESSVSHKCGVFSFGHFEHCRNEVKDSVRSAVDGDMLWQLLKTLTHEVCHLFQLQHCRFFSCTMNESHTVKEAMEQPLFLCPVCLRKLQKSCHFSLLERYSDLLQILTDISQQCPYKKFEESVEWLQKCIHFLKSSS